MFRFSDETIAAILKGLSISGLASFLRVLFEPHQPLLRAARLMLINTVAGGLAFWVSIEAKMPEHYGTLTTILTALCAREVTAFVVELTNQLLRDPKGWAASIRRRILGKKEGGNK